MKNIGIFKQIFKTKEFKRERSRLERLLDVEINVFLKKIYSKYGSKLKPNPLQIEFTDISVEPTHLTETLPWKFKIKNIKKVRTGDIGIIKVPYYRASISKIRKQTAAMIAAQIFILHKFANNKPKQFEKIRNAGGALGRVFSKIRDTMLINKIENETMHVLAGIKCLDWTRIKNNTIIFTIKQTNITNKKIAHELNINEKDLRAIQIEFSKLNKKISLEELEKTDMFIQREIEEIDYLTGLLNKDKRLLKKIGIHNKPIKEHLIILKSIKENLIKIKKNIQNWEHKDKKVCNLLNKKLNVLPTIEKMKKIEHLIKRESKHIKNNIHILHSLYEQFEHKKAEIIQDIRLNS